MHDLLSSLSSQHRPHVVISLDAADVLGVSIEARILPAFGSRHLTDLGPAASIVRCWSGLLHYVDSFNPETSQVLQEQRWFMACKNVGPAGHV